MSLAARIRNSDRLVNGIAWCMARYLRFCYATTRWEKRGFDALHGSLDAGEPVIIVCWHQRLMYAPVSWDHSKGKACTLRAISHAGRISGATQEQLGLLSVPMHEDQSNMTASRKIAKLMRDGVSLGITGDGPEGPAFVMNSAALEWARLTGKPVFLFAFSTRRYSTWNTWDKLMFPKPFTKGVVMYQRWDGEVPRRPKDGEMEALRAKLEADLSAFTELADAGVTELP